MTFKEIEDQVYEDVTVSTLTYDEIIQLLTNVKARVDALPKVHFEPSE